MRTAVGRWFVGLVSTALVLPAQAPVGAPDVRLPAGFEHIDEADLRELAGHLASDELGGRYTGSSGQIAAAEYIANRLEKLGLEPLGDEEPDGRSFFQRWPVEKTYLDPERTSIAFGETELERGFAVLAGTEQQVVDIEGELVFCGFGSNGELPPGKLEGKIPVVVLKPNKALRRAQAQLKMMLGMAELRTVAKISKRLGNRGAKSVVFCLLSEQTAIPELMNYAGLLPDKPMLKYGRDAGMSMLTRAAQTPGPAVFLSQRESKQLLDYLKVTIGEDQSVLMGMPDQEPAGRLRVAVVVDDDAHALNVVAVLRGSDERLRDEAVVISAHMDHMGTRMDGDVFNGADDNASGTAGLLELADAFVNGDPPRRSIVFLSVSGEELGLWGSAFYARNPTWPLEQTAANVNIDMIGRNGTLSQGDDVSITPSYRHEKYSSIARDASRLAPKVGLNLTVGDQYYQRSDHYNFAVRGVPVVFFCDGEHEDYHQVTDEADKLNYPKMARIVKLAYWTAFEVANTEARPEGLGRQRRW